ncbi:MAG TPA: LamG domain-containing protein [Verrucomicrobiae bacterium]|nr:LamG domain-containing protein [Verrucomicrobiae bacterium]
MIYLRFRLPFAVFVALAIIVGGANYSIGQNLIAHWTLDEANAPYADSSGNNINLFQDTNTTVAISGAGMAGTAAQLNWQNPPGIATRLFATNTTLQTDSFGFSFWLNPNYLNQNDNLIAKEMAYNSAATNRISWQVHIGNNNGSATEPIELIVYGDNRALGSFYGNVESVTNIPLHVSMTSWIHVAGGYDSHSGALNLFVNGIQTVSSNSVPGANNSDGSPLDIGSGKNGNDYVVFAAGTYIDDVQIYDQPLTAADVADLMANPGQSTNVFAITGISHLNTNGDDTITFNSTAGMGYNIEVSTNLVSFTTAANVTAAGHSTVITLSKTYVDQVLGNTPRSQLYFRVQQLSATTVFGNCD